jgi:hypothetical protein
MTTNRLKWQLAGGVALITLLGGVLFVASRDGQPRYAGKRLSTWLDELAPLHSDEAARGDPRSAQSQAVRAIGTNALPWLLGEMRAEEMRLNGWINWALDKQPVFKFRLPDIDYRLRRATIGFQLLGEMAEPAIPDLLSLVDSRPGYAPSALAYIGPRAIPALRQCLTNTRSWSYRHGQMIPIPGNTIGAIHNSVNQARLSESDVAILIPTIREWAKQSTNQYASLYAIGFLRSQGINDF